MAYQPRRFTEDQIERANRVDVVDYAKSIGLEIQKNGNWHKAKHKGGLYFHRGANTWHWEANDTGGTGAISLCMELENKTWVEAVKTLLNEDMEPIRHTSDWKPEPETPREFHLPNQNDTYRHVFAYLTKTRGIDADIVKTMVDKKLLYENTQRSCVFVGRDKDGVAKHASVRSTNTQGKTFKQDVAGSQKAYSFSITGTSGTLNVFEASIDALSYMSLQKLYGRDTNDSYLSLGGVENKALERFLADNKGIERIRICTDHDEAGEKAVVRIYEKYGQDYKVTRHRPTNKDFNEDLVAIRQQEQIKQREKSQSKEQAASNTEQNTKPAEQPEQTENPVDTPDGKLSEEILRQAGVSSRLIEWYNAEPELCVYENGAMHIEGSSPWLFVCDNPVEVFAYQHKEEQEYMRTYSADRYESDSHYITYKNADQIAAYVKEHPEICIIGVATSRTPAGEQAFKDIESKLASHNINVGRSAPNLCSHVDDIRMQNKVSSVLEQTPMPELQPDMEVGMEM